MNELDDFQPSVFGPLANPKFMLGLIIGLFVLGVVVRLLHTLGWWGPRYTAD